ncbi:MAG: SpoIIE family protein phosphatase [Clostridia bacterium]|nr:SpoIIE family protein phosphatase [Clostridia bacterium]
MKSLKKVKELIVYSEYGSMVFSIGLLLILFFISFIWESSLTKFINTTGMQGIPFVFEFGIIAISLLVVNICRRAIKTTNRTRMILYAVFFALGGGVGFIAFANVNWLNSELNYDTLLYLSSLSRLIIAVGMLLGAMVSIDATIENYNATLLRVIIYGLWTISVIVALSLNTGRIALDIIIPEHIHTITEYLVSVVLILTFAFHYRSYAIKKNRYLMLFMNGLIILLIAQIIRLTFVNYTYLFHFIYTGYIFIGYIYLYNAIFGYNILSPIQHLINEEKQIKLYAENLEVIVDRRTTEMKNNNMRLIQEIEYAKSIQQSLLPARKVNFNKVIFVSEYFPCERLSGDFFDIYRLDDENIGMYVLDVSGHGVSAALMTMFCNNYIKSSEKLIMKYRGLKPHRNLKHFYEEFNKMKFPDEMYMVMFFASYNIETGILTYASGGINCYPILMKKDGTKSYLDKSQGFPICKMSAYFTPTYTSEILQLDKGDRIIFYTDGLVDNRKNNTISQETLEEVLFDYRNRSLKSLNEKIKSYINEEMGSNEDDITYFIMEV